MIWKEFTYLTPTTLDEAIRLLAEHGREARVLAGGTDLLLRMRTGEWRPRCVVNIKQLPGLLGIGFDPDSGLRLGAMVTAADLVRSEVVQAHYPALAQGAAVMASVQIRNLATVGGNLCNAAPSADLAPPLIALGGSAVIAGPEGQRRVPLDEFFLGPGQTILAPDELLVAITLPFPRPGSAAVYLKNSPRQAMDIAVVGVGLTSAARTCASSWVLSRQRRCVPGGPRHCCDARRSPRSGSQRRHVLPPRRPNPSTTCVVRPGTGGRWSRC
jgi:CO/xanthine dehydrogenase FAD-binding subunit